MTPAARPVPPVDLEAVLTTAELARRPARPPDHAAEVRALTALADALAADPPSLFRKLVEAALELTRADSAGLSLHEPGAGPGVFRWPAVAGAWARHTGGSLPRDASPCGVVVDRDAPLLFAHPGRHFPDVAAIDPPVVEGLLVPFHAGGAPVGTVWVVTHTPDRTFDAEDLRLLTSLSRFAAAARLMATRDELEVRVGERTRELAGANAALRASEERFRAVVANLPNAAAFVVGHDLRYRLAEGGGLRAAGFSPAELEGKTVEEAMSPGEAAEYVPRYRRALAGEPFRWEHAAHGRHYLSHGLPVRGAGGEVTAALAVSYDITDRKRAEDALRESEERFRLLVENARDHAIFGLSPDGTVTSWNEGAERLLGYPTAEAVGRSGADFFTPEDRAAGLPDRELATAAADGKGMDDNWLVRKDGTRFWASGATSAVRDGAGNLTGFAKVVRDRTEQQAAAEAVRESRERLRIALAAARMGVWQWDVAADEHVRDANLNRLLGLPAKETARPLADFLGRVHPDDRGAVAGAFGASAGQGRRLSVEFRVVWPNGTARWLRDQGDVFGWGGGAVTHLSGACVDITDLKEAEAGLRKARDELEGRVAERTAELAAAYDALAVQMAHRRDLARRLATAQEDERRRVSRDLHDDLGQHLTALILGLTALEGGSADPAPLRQLRELAERVGRQAHRIAVELRPTALDDLGLYAALRNYAEEWTRQTKVPVELHCPAPGGGRLPPEAETAAYRIVQEALTNVARHAGATRVGVVVDRRPGQLLAIVEDDGAGFDPDGAADPSRPRLGLAGMRERAELVGGSVEVESAPGRGTTVFARLPLPAPAPPAAD